MNDAVVMQALESARSGSGWNPLGAFEIDFDRPLDLDAFRNAVGGGRGDLRLWMIEVETEPDFARFLGVDLVTWARLFIGVGKDYLFVTVPGRGSLDVVHRIADELGKDRGYAICFNGVEIYSNVPGGIVRQNGE